MANGVKLSVLLLVVVLVATPVVSGQSTPAEPDSDNTITRIQVYENATARWTIQVRTRLETEEEVGQFEAFQERLRSDDSTVLDGFRTRMTGVVRNAANQTGREMVAQDFGISTHIQEIPRRWGVVSYEFSWVGFAVQRDEQLLVGDIFQGGFFLAEDDRLVIAPPAEYNVMNTTPAPDATPAGAVVWSGRRDFSDERPRVEIAPKAPTPAETATATRGGTAATEFPGKGDGLSTTITQWGLPLMAIAFIILGYLLMRRLGAIEGGGESGGSNPTAGSGGVMTNEEQVRSMLEDSGGQLRQADVAERMDWSASKTSRVLSGMAQSGEIEKLQIGRENIIRLPEDE